MYPPALRPPPKPNWHLQSNAGLIDVGVEHQREIERHFGVGYKQLIRLQREFGVGYKQLIRLQMEFWFRVDNNSSVPSVAKSTALPHKSSFNTQLQRELYWPFIPTIKIEYSFTQLSTVQDCNCIANIKSSSFDDHSTISTGYSETIKRECEMRSRVSFALFGSFFSVPNLARFLQTSLDLFSSIDFVGALFCLTKS